MCVCVGGEGMSDETSIFDKTACIFHNEYHQRHAFFTMNIIKGEEGSSHLM